MVLISKIETTIGVAGFLNFIVLCVGLKLTSNDYNTMYFTAIYSVIVFASCFFIVPPVLTLLHCKIPRLIRATLAPVDALFFIVHTLAVYFGISALKSNGKITATGTDIIVAYGNAVFSFGSRKVLFAWIGLSLLLIGLVFLSHTSSAMNKLSGAKK